MELINRKYDRQNKAVYVGEGYEKDVANNYLGIRKYLDENVKSGEVVMVMGAGDVDKILEF